MNITRYRRYAWGVLFYNLLVILWGAFVRATGSGAGCGRHWPLCNGEVIPRPQQIETIIEFVHRATSGLALLSVIGLVWGAWKLYPAKSPVRAAARWSGIFVVTESLLGAMLVLFEWVALDDSVQRAISMPLHLINTLFLLASLSLTAWYTSGYPPAPIWKGMKQHKNILLATLGLMLIGASGAVTALGDTLFPDATLLDDFSAGAHFLIRLRVWHPVVAVLAGYLILRQAINWPVQPAALKPTLITLVLLQWGLGALNVVLRAPVWLQLVHLLLADTIWICYVLFINQTLQEEPA